MRERRDVSERPKRFDPAGSLKCRAAISVDSVSLFRPLLSARFNSRVLHVSQRYWREAIQQRGMNERNDLLQVVRAASPVLLRVIVLGAFFIYCTVSARGMLRPVLDARERFVFMKPR